MRRLRNRSNGLPKRYCLYLARDAPVRGLEGKKAWVTEGWEFEAPQPEWGNRLFWKIRAVWSPIRHW